MRWVLRIGNTVDTAQGLMTLAGVLFGLVELILSLL
jgi:hypothetical protein